MTERHMQLEALATDEAMGVTFGPGEESVFPDGSSAACCTDCARRIIELAGNGVMYGWMEGTNPTTIVAHDQGHDFVVVDDRYLVDAWAKLVERSLEMAREAKSAAVGHENPYAVAIDGRWPVLATERSGRDLFIHILVLGPVAMPAAEVGKLITKLFVELRAENEDERQGDESVWYYDELATKLIAADCMVVTVSTWEEHDDGYPDIPGADS